jgi:propionyl-CoA synthetase
VLIENDKFLDNHIIFSEKLLEETLLYSNIDINTIKSIPLKSNDPLYLLYTSGTTGAPKGILRDIGGTCVSLNFAMRTVFDISNKEVFFATSDLGWVVGHSFILYGPLLRGATSICYEGKPINTPNGKKIWEMIDKFKVKSLFTSPTALRAIKREDPEGIYSNEFNIKSLKTLHCAGERCDPDTLQWAIKCVSDEVLVNDNWWQTETGWPICSNNATVYRFPTIPGAAGIAMPGYDIRIMEKGENENEG